MIYLTNGTMYLGKNEIPFYVYEVGEGDTFTLPELGCHDTTVMKRGKHKLEYVNVYAGFDIETTNLIEDARKEAYMYIWQMSIATDKKGVVYLGRSWQLFIDLLKAVKDKYAVSPVRRLIIWDANFGFEFQFMRKWIEWDSEEYAFFAKEMRKPLLASCMGGIEFRDCLSISGGSLAQLAKDYCTTKKLVGDLDYSKMRSNRTPLSMQEYRYCINDVVILSEYSSFVFDRYIRPNKKVPLTKTGLLRQEVRNNLRDTVKNKKEFERYKEMIQTAYPDADTYAKWFRYLFRGGFVHANCLWADKVIENVLMYDITSSYPAQMNLRYYPITPFKKVDVEKLTDEKMDAYINSRCCIFEAEFWDIEGKNAHSIESKHKLIEWSGGKFDNGRLYKAEYIRVMLTELDYLNYKEYYRWAKMRIISFKTSKRGKLPPFIIKALNNHYVAKNALKRQGKQHTSEYAITKSGVNSAYGLMVTRISLDKVTYSGDEWGIDDIPLDYAGEVRKQILLPQWGIYVSAHARRQLLHVVRLIEEVVPNSVIYCDTDSIKCVYDARIAEVIKRYNDGIGELLTPLKAQSDAFSDLGMFDLEYDKPVDRFKTIGAKRYIYEVNGKIEATIAGLPKGVLIKQTEDTFKEFSIDGMRIPCEASEKLTTAYNDEEHRAIIDGEEMHEKSSVALYDIPFSMFTEKDYIELLCYGVEDIRKKL